MARDSRVDEHRHSAGYANLLYCEARISREVGLVPREAPARAAADRVRSFRPMIWPELSRNEQRAYPQPPRREQQAIGQMQMLYVGPVHLGSRVESAWSILCECR